jgi:hypothetical protein
MTFDTTQGNGVGEQGDGRRPWRPMELVCIGQMSELIQGGVAKTGTAADPGDPGKPPGGGGE